VCAAAGRLLWWGGDVGDFVGVNLSSSSSMVEVRNFRALDPSAATSPVADKKDGIILE